MLGRKILKVRDTCVDAEGSRLVSGQNTTATVISPWGAAGMCVRVHSPCLLLVHHFTGNTYTEQNFPLGIDPLLGGRPFRLPTQVLAAIPLHRLFLPWSVGPMISSMPSTQAICCLVLATAFGTLSEQRRTHRAPTRPRNALRIDVDPLFLLPWLLGKGCRVLAATVSLLACLLAPLALSPPSFA